MSIVPTTIRKARKLFRDPHRFFFDRRCKELAQAVGAKAPAFADSRISERRRAQPGQMFRAYLAAQELAALIAQRSATGKGLSMLDIGGGRGIHARYFRAAFPELDIDIVDLQKHEEPLAYEGDYQSFQPTRRYDVIWASHVLEHVPNPGQFLSKVREDLAPGGIVGITVPPLKNQVMFEHLSLWNAGQLLINLARAGFDCRDAQVATYGYNVSVVLESHSEASYGDKACLPPVPWTGYTFDGEIPFLNWQTRRLETTKLGAASKHLDDALRELATGGIKQPKFFEARYLGKSEILYYDSALHCVMRPE